MSFSSIPLTSQTAPVTSYTILWTADKRQKLKRWNDGILRYHTFNKRVMVYDTHNHLICSQFRAADEGHLESGDELMFESHLVTIEELRGDTEQDLRPLYEKTVERRAEKAKANGVDQVKIGYTNNATPSKVPPITPLPQRNVMANMSTPLQGKRRADGSNQDTPIRLNQAGAAKASTTPATALGRNVRTEPRVNTKRTDVTITGSASARPLKRAFKTPKPANSTYQSNPVQQDASVLDLSNEVDSDLDMVEVAEIEARAVRSNAHDTGNSPMARKFHQNPPPVFYPPKPRDVEATSTTPVVASRPLASKMNSPDVKQLPHPRSLFKPPQPNLLADSPKAVPSAKESLFVGSEDLDDEYGSDIEEVVPSSLPPTPASTVSGSIRTSQAPAGSRSIGSTNTDRPTNVTKSTDTVPLEKSTPSKSPARSDRNELPEALGQSAETPKDKPKTLSLSSGRGRNARRMLSTRPNIVPTPESRAAVLPVQSHTQRSSAGKVQQLHPSQLDDTTTKAALSKDVSTTSNMTKPSPPPLPSSSSSSYGNDIDLADIDMDIDMDKEPESKNQTTTTIQRQLAPPLPSPLSNTDIPKPSTLPPKSSRPLSPSPPAQPPPRKKLATTSARELLRRETEEEEDDVEVEKEKQDVEQDKLELEETKRTELVKKPKSKPPRRSPSTDEEEEEDDFVPLPSTQAIAKIRKLAMKRKEKFTVMDSDDDDNV